MSATLKWTGTLTATASIAHGGETRGTITLLRREIIMQPDGRLVHVPVISGNAFRGRLRRIGEELLRDAIGYEGLLPLPAAHALRGGGALAKTTGEPLSGRRLAELRHLIPHIGVFGCAASGRIIDGSLQVGKVIPRVLETAHLSDETAAPQLSAFRATQIESYVRADDSNAHDFADVIRVGTVPLGTDGSPPLTDLAALPTDTTQLMLYRVETFPAGTVFTTWLRLDRATDLELAFFTDVLNAFIATGGQIGGRTGIGHGTTRVELTRRTLSGNPTSSDWRTHVLEHRDAALNALQALS